MDGLFNFATPATLQQNFMKDRVLNTEQMAQMPLLNQVAAMGGNTGSMLGNVVGRAFGGRSPEEARMEQMQGLLSNANMNDPEGLMSLSQRLQSINPAVAQELAQRAMNMRKTQVEIEAQQADMLNKQRDPINKLINSGKYTPESVEAYEQSGNISDLKLLEGQIKFSTDAEEVARELYGKSFGSLTPEETAAVNVLRNQRRIAEKQAGAARTTVDARSFNAAETEYGKAVGKDSAQRDVALLDTVSAAETAMPKLLETKDLIVNGNINVGIASNVQDVIARARSKFLADKAAGKNVADSQYLDSLLGSDVFSQIAALGIGARGLDTPAEREFLREVITGTRALDRETLRRMVDFRIDATERSVNKYNERLAKGEFNKYQEVTGRKLEPIKLPSREKTSTGATPTMRFNPATGRLEPVRN
jgi:hypothetical protein